MLKQKNFSVFCSLFHIDGMLTNKSRIKKKNTRKIIRKFCIVQNEFDAWFDFNVPTHIFMRKNCVLPFRFLRIQSFALFGAAHSTSEFPQIQRVRSMRFGRIASLFFDARFSFHISLILFNVIFPSTNTDTQAQRHTCTWPNELNGKSVNSFNFHVKQISNNSTQSRNRWWKGQGKKMCVNRLRRYIYIWRRN